MKKRFLSLALALAVLCQTALCLAAFGPFSTINNGGATTLKGLGTNPDPLLPNEKWRQGAVVTPVSNLAANTEVFVTSVRDWFRWDPGSTATPDDITVVSLTANGGSAGRFLRELRADPYWRAQTAWFVDSAGNDENDGSSLAPVKTDVEIQRRWSQEPTLLTVPIVVTYVNSPTTETNFDVKLLSGGSLTFLGVPTLSSPQVLSAVTAQSRGSQQGWDMTGTALGAAQVASLAQISASGTPANVAAYAIVLKDLGGNKVRVAPFGTAAVAATTFTNITPGAGDSVVILTLPTLKVGRIRIAQGTAAARSASPVANVVVFDSLLLNGNGGTATARGAIESNGVEVFYFRATWNGIIFSGTHSVGGIHRMAGGGCAAGGAVSLVTSSASLQLSSTGLLTNLAVNQGGVVALTQDTYFQSCTMTMAAGVRVLSSGAAYWDRTGDGVTVVPGADYVQTGAVPDWGTGATGHGVNVQSGGSYVYATKPTINSGLGAGREAQVGGTDKLYSAVPYVEATNNAALVLTQ
jgi:hypothetical protein